MLKEPLFYNNACGRNDPMKVKQKNAASFDTAFFII